MTIDFLLNHFTFVCPRADGSRSFELINPLSLVFEKEDQAGSWVGEVKDVDCDTYFGYRVYFRCGEKNRSFSLEEIGSWEVKSVYFVEDKGKVYVLL